MIRLWGIIDVVLITCIRCFMNKKQDTNSGTRSPKAVVCLEVHCWKLSLSTCLFFCTFLLETGCQVFVCSVLR